MVTLEQFRYHPTHAMRPPACFDFHYAKPGMVAIFGDNGSGKSTLAQLMAGWYPDFLPGEIEGTGVLSGNCRSSSNQLPSSWCSNHLTCSFPAVRSALRRKWRLVPRISALPRLKLCAVLTRRSR